MSEQRWEYCTLRIDGRTHNEKDDSYQYGLEIRYFGSKILTLSSLDGRSWKEYNPWSKAMALLGEYGWEMISVQHLQLENVERGSDRLRPYEAVAYFKRPMLAGRNIDQPKLELA